MDRETLLDWLAVAESAVREGARELLRQRELLSRLQTQGHNIDHLDRLMAALKT
jgi:hypothetical protein